MRRTLSQSGLHSARTSVAMPSRFVQRVVGLVVPGRHYPIRLSFLLDAGWRRLVLSPETHAARLHLAPEGRVLEVGSGPGYLTAAVARYVPRGLVVALDIQHAMLQRTRMKVGAAKQRNVSYVQADALGMPFSMQQFDAAYVVTVLGELQDWDAGLDELHRVLRAGGLLSITEHLPDPDFTRFTRVQRQTEKHGFAFIERFGSWWNYTANFAKR